MSFTLDDLYAATKSHYSGYELDLPSGNTLELRNAIRLSKAERKSFSELQKDLTAKVEMPEVERDQREDESDEDYEARLEAELEAVSEAADKLEASRRATLHKIFKLLAQDKETAKEALSIFGEDLGVLMTLIQEYGKATQAGEA